MRRCDRRGVRGAEIWSRIPTDQHASSYPGWWLVLTLPGCGTFGSGKNRIGEVFKCSEASWPAQTQSNDCPPGDNCDCRCTSNTCSRYECIGCVPPSTNGEPPKTFGCG
jgi:hypothetical protein